MQPARMQGDENIFFIAYQKFQYFYLMVQATAMWLAFDSDVLKVSADTSLAEFPLDPYNLYLAAKYLEKTFSAFDKKFSISITEPSAYDVLCDGLDNLFKEAKGTRETTGSEKPEENGFSDMSLPGCDDQHSFVLVSTPLIIRARFKAFPSKGGNAGSGQGSKIMPEGRSARSPTGHRSSRSHR